MSNPNTREGQRKVAHSLAVRLGVPLKVRSLKEAPGADGDTCDAE